MTTKRSLAGGPAVIAALASLLSMPTLAGLTQNDVDGTGGLLSALSGLANASNPDPGYDPATGFHTFNLDEESFAGEATAAGSTSFSDGTHISSSAGTAGLGFVDFTASAESMFDFSGAISGGVVHGGWVDTLTIDAPAHTGETAIWLFRVDVQAELAASGFAGSPRVEIEPYVEHDNLDIGVPGVDLSDSDSLATSVQHAEWGLVLSAIGASETRSVADTVTFAAEIVVGEPFELGIFALAVSNARDVSAYPDMLSTADVHTAVVTWGGSAGLTVAGVPVVDFSVESDSGVDWLQQIPAADYDVDGVLNTADNCLLEANPLQEDTDGDSIGNYCDADITGDCNVNFADLAALKAGFFPVNDPNADFNGDGLVNFADLAVMAGTFFNGPNPGPGPSGLPNACD